jgi:hypothetical protein
LTPRRPSASAASSAEHSVTTDPSAAAMPAGCSPAPPSSARLTSTDPARVSPPATQASRAGGLRVTSAAQASSTTGAVYWRLIVTPIGIRSMAR